MSRTRRIVVRRLGYRFLPGRRFGPCDVSQRERYSENGRQQNRKTVGASCECTRPIDVHEASGVGKGGVQTEKLPLEMAPVPYRYINILSDQITHSFILFI